MFIWLRFQKTNSKQHQTFSKGPINCRISKKVLSVYNVDNKTIITVALLMDSIETNTFSKNFQSWWCEKDYLMIFLKFFFSFLFVFNKVDEFERMREYVCVPYRRHHFELYEITHIAYAPNLPWYNNYFPNKSVQNRKNNWIYLQCICVFKVVTNKLRPYPESKRCYSKTDQLTGQHY